jgi:hypothetical protein
MLPFVRDGDVVVVVPLTRSTVDRGDIVCYEDPPGRLFLHRMIARRGDRIVTKGDALTSAEAIESAQLLGTVVAVERHGRLIPLDGALARWRGRAIVALRHVIPPLVSLAFQVRRVARGCRRG